MRVNDSVIDESLEQQKKEREKKAGNQSVSAMKRYMQNARRAE